MRNESCLREAAAALARGDPGTQPGIFCDYRNPINPLDHQVCRCYATSPSADSTWLCFRSNRCPATQPVYPTRTASGGGLTPQMQRSDRPEQLGAAHGRSIIAREPAERPFAA